MKQSVNEIDAIKWEKSARVALVTLILMAISGFVCASTDYAFSLSNYYIRNVALDCLAIIIITLEFFSLMNGMAPDRVKRIFMTFLCLCAFYLWLDEFCWLVNDHIEYRGLNIVFNTLFYLEGIWMIWLFWKFLAAWIGYGEANWKWATRLVIIIAGIGTILVLGNLKWGYYFKVDKETGAYGRSELYYIGIIVISVLLVLCAFRICRSEMKIQSKIILLCYPLAPCVEAIFTIYAKGPTLAAISVFLSVSLLYSLLFVQREREVARKREELTNARMELMLSQIRPHFICNTLIMIRELYQEDSDRADDMMLSFTEYLQANFSELGSTKPLTIDREVEHTKYYTSLEKGRWPDMEFEYDIQATGFLVPALTLQPLVENAVRHGLMPLDSGGKIIIKTEEDDTFYRIYVIDNGLGFDSDAIEEDESDYRRHIAIKNVKERVEKMCKGEMVIQSKIGEGTIVKIQIPK